VQRLATALVEACPEETSAAPGAEPSVALRAWASLTASVWLAAVRGLLIEQRTELADAERSAEASLVVERLAEEVLTQLEAVPSLAQCPPAIDAPPAQLAGWVRRAV
jgi:hypothetical protein